MGDGRWKPSDWDVYSRTTTTGRSTAAIFSRREIHADLNPYGVAVRESRDSDLNPQSNAIIVGLDVTGSMDPVLDAMARQGLNTLITEIYDRKPILDPHLMLMGIGDAEAGDRAPLQVTQFEADIRIAEQLTKIYLERGGGGNNYESYALAWYFGGLHTAIDCFEKRGKKGYLFTVGDEGPTPYLKEPDIQKVTGDIVAQRLMAQELLTLASRYYEVFHLMVEEGNHFRSAGDRVVKEWTALLGQRALPLKDHTKLSEVIVSAIQITEGALADDVIKSWDGKTEVAVRAAVSSLTGTVSDGGDVVRF